MKKKIIALLLLAVIVMGFSTACGKGGNELVGHWVAASESSVLDEITLRSDGSGTVDGLWNSRNGKKDDISLTWYSEDNILTIVTNEYGERTYGYRISGDKMWLEDSYLFNGNYLFFRK